MPRKLGPLVTEIGEETGAWPNSVYRDNDVAVMLHACGKKTQAELFAELGPGVANPPDRGTHILKSDAVAYVGPIGRRLRWWQCGMDYNDNVVLTVKAAAARRGWIMFQPYPGTVEWHHLNLVKKPKIRLPLPDLKEGMHGARVKRLTKQLAYVHRPKPHHDTYLEHSVSHFDAKVKDAVKAFQRDHRLPDDGVVGMHTKRQLKVSVRHERRQRKIDDLRERLHKATAERTDARRMLDKLEAAEHPNQRLIRQVKRNLRKRQRLVAHLEAGLRHLGADPHPD